LHETAAGAALTEFFDFVPAKCLLHFTWNGCWRSADGVFLILFPQNACCILHGTAAGAALTEFFDFVPAKMPAAFCMKRLLAQR
jgi:hypothetical protein